MITDSIRALEGIGAHPGGRSPRPSWEQSFRLLARQDGQQGGHGLGRSPLVPAAEGHQYAAGADGESNRSQRPRREAHFRLDAISRREGAVPGAAKRGGGASTRTGVLGGAVGIQEGTAQVHDGVARQRMTIRGPP